MSTVDIAGKAIELDEQGFMEHMDQWNEEIAAELARREGYGRIDEQQMEILRFMRSYYKKFCSFPILQSICRNIHQPKECVTEQFINPEKAWKIAGLPKLDNVQFVAVDGQHFLMQECC